MNAETDRAGARLVSLLTGERMSPRQGTFAPLGVRLIRGCRRRGSGLLLLGLIL